jgi:erythromycin esterase
MNSSAILNEIIKKSVPFIDQVDFTQLIDHVKDKRIVMLGESTHGTREFYEWRSKLSAELIQKHGFNFIAVEGDWPPCQSINQYIQRRTQMGAFETLGKFKRWPTWMWGNLEMVGLLDWLREYNLESSKAVGFYGLDVYSLFESIDEVVKLVKKIDHDLARKLMDFYACFGPYRNDERAYARSLFSFPSGCEEESLSALKLTLEKKLINEDVFDAQQNARIVHNAEKYYRAMVFSNGDQSWNVRDHHMMETLEILLKNHGDESKCIIWEHNTHIGDYRATDMVLDGQINLGGLAREKYGEENVALVGFTTYQGSVIASKAWDGEIEVMEIPEAKKESLESYLHEAIPGVGHQDYYLLFDSVDRKSLLNDFLAHRAIGVIYHARHEQRGNYVPSKVAERYDALVFLDQTHSLSPMALNYDRSKFPETYPFGTRI